MMKSTSYGKKRKIQERGKETEHTGRGFKRHRTTPKLRKKAVNLVQEIEKETEKKSTGRGNKVIQPSMMKKLGGARSVSKHHRTK